jgi:hypothetical protein
MEYDEDGNEIKAVIGMFFVTLTLIEVFLCVFLDI